MPIVKNEDPKPEERQYARHAQTGDLGWIVKRDGKDMMKYDRPGQDLVVPFMRNGDGEPIGWKLEGKPAPMTPFQVSMVAYAADRELDRFLGNVRRPKAWIDLHEDRRREWASDGPGDATGPRQELFEGIMKALEPYTR